jgi:hypothetical protein
LKENLLWVRTFKTIDELRAELAEFARRYNETWLAARHGSKTPASVLDSKFVRSTKPQMPVFLQLVDGNAE